MLALGYNRVDKHAKARARCDRALAMMSEGDRECIALFLEVDLETIADAGLGRVAAAFRAPGWLLSANDNAPARGSQLTDIERRE